MGGSLRAVGRAGGGSVGRVLGPGSRGRGGLGPFGRALPVATTARDPAYVKTFRQWAGGRGRAAGCLLGLGSALGGRKGWTWT